MVFEKADTYNLSLKRETFQLICHFYSVRFPKNEKLIETVTIGAVIYLFCFGVAQTFFPVRPFWNDEWRLIYNLKFIFID